MENILYLAKEKNLLTVDHRHKSPAHKSNLRPGASLHSQTQTHKDPRRYCLLKNPDKQPCSRVNRKTPGTSHQRLVPAQSQVNFTVVSVVALPFGGAVSSSQTCEFHRRENAGWAQTVCRFLENPQSECD